MSIEIKQELQDSILLVPTLAHTSETWTWNEGQKSRIQAMELRGVCGVNGKSSENVCGGFGMCSKEKRIYCRMVVLIYSTLRVFNHLE